ncbi:MAG: DUF1127 domain-containing protein [Pseudomonadota bacterium]
MTTQTLTLNQLKQLDRHVRLPALATLFVLLALVVTKWAMRAQTRAQLRDLPSHILEDIGVTEAEARREADKRFWQR